MLIQVCVMGGGQSEKVKGTKQTGKNDKEACNILCFYIINSFCGLSNLRCSVVRSPKKRVAYIVTYV